jgi:Mor family transcriptional regulator
LFWVVAQLSGTRSRALSSRAEREQRMLADRRGGATVGQLTRAHQLSHKTVRNVLNRHGLAGAPK